MPVKGDTMPMPLDFPAKFIELDGGVKKLADHYGVSTTTVRDRWIKSLEIRQFELEDVPKGRPAEMLEERDLDPDQWQVRGLRVNEWEMAGELQRQTRLDIVPRIESIRPARAEGWKPPKPKPKTSGKTLVKFICGDHQAPYHDPKMHTATLNWLAEVQPVEGVIDGDLVDLPTRSTYKTKAKWNAAANDCIEQAYRIMCDYRSASPDTVWKYLFGNHEQRMWDSLMRDDEEAATITRAGESSPVLSLPYLVRLDELGIEYFDNYPHDVYKLSPDTAVIHGNKSKPGSGGTSQHETKDRRYNVFHGHDHSQAITPFTTHDIDNKPITTYGIAVGASCQVAGGLGYAVRPDWQNGHATATFDKDGNLIPELIHFIDEKLRWRGDSW
jgi:hypothetical protein